MRRSSPTETAGLAAVPMLPASPPGSDATFPALLPPDTVHISKPLNEMIERLTWRLDEIAKILGISRRALDRLRAAGRFPRPDLTIGRMPLWRPETIRAWVKRGGRP